MPAATAVHSSPNAQSYANQAALLDADGAKTSFATSASPVTVTGTGLNGALMETASGADGWVLGRLPRLPTIFMSSAANQYNAVAPIVLTAIDGMGVEQVLSFSLPTNDDGNQTIRLAVPTGVIRIVKYEIPAQLGTGGAFTFGFEDLFFHASAPARQVRAGIDGNIKVGYLGGFTAILPFKANEKHDIVFQRLYSDSDTGAYPILVFA